MRPLRFWYYVGLGWRAFICTLRDHDPRLRIVDTSRGPFVVTTCRRCARVLSCLELTAPVLARVRA